MGIATKTASWIVIFKNRFTDQVIARHFKCSSSLDFEALLPDFFEQCRGNPENYDLVHVEPLKSIPTVIVEDPKYIFHEEQ